MNVFDDMGVFWAEIADLHQTDQQLGFLKSQLKPGGYVLDLACGTGRHTIPLSQAGFGMVGLDVSAKLLRIAKQRSKEIAVVRGDMRFLPFKAEAFAAAVSMDTSFGYLPSEQDDAASLAEVQRVLGRDGVLVVDVFNREELKRKYGDKGYMTRREYPSFWLLQKRTVTKDGGRLHDLWTIYGKADGQIRVFEHEARLYTLDGLHVLLKNAGFAVKEVYGDYDKSVWSVGSSKLIVDASASL
jgi:ubiquinone/menaquinone biosynthesis C-methylase UbiE